MYTVLIAHRDVKFAEQLAAELHTTGHYRVITCPGPWPPTRCIRCDVAYCPITEGADLMIYDPELTAFDADGRKIYLAAASANAHPEVPMLLAWPQSSPPDPGTLRAIRMQAPHVYVASHEQQPFLNQIAALLSAQVPHAATIG
jgi:hypothetical protein